MTVEQSIPKRLIGRNHQFNFWGAELSGRGIRPSNGLIRRLDKLPLPTNKLELRTFLGLAVQLNRYTWRQDRLLEDIR